MSPTQAHSRCRIRAVGDFGAVIGAAAVGIRVERVGADARETGFLSIRQSVVVRIRIEGVWVPELEYVVPANKNTKDAAYQTRWPPERNWVLHFF